MEILVTGATGVLGTDLCHILRTKNHVIHATDLNATENVEPLDVRKFDQVNAFVDKYKPGLVIHLAAETDVDRCEMEIDHAYLTNTIGTQHITLACQLHNAVMVYVSTMAVFNGEKTEPYIEFDTPNPLNVYGKTKFEGERAVQNLLHRYFILRAGWMIGGGRKEKKFVAKIIQQLEKTNKIKAVNDKFGSPTYTVDFSNCLAELITTKYYGLYHCVNTGGASRYEIAKKIVEILGRKDVTIEPVSSDQFPLPAPRPRSETARNYKLDLLEMNTMRPWEEALLEYINSNFSDMIKR